MTITKLSLPLDRDSTESVGAFDDFLLPTRCQLQLKSLISLRLLVTYKNTAGGNGFWVYV